MNYNKQNAPFRPEKPHNSPSPRSPKKVISFSNLHYTIDNSAVKWELSQTCLNSAERKQSQCKALNGNDNGNLPIALSPYRPNHFRRIHQVQCINIILRIILCTIVHISSKISIFGALMWSIVSARKRRTKRHTPIILMIGYSTEIKSSILTAQT